MTRLTRFARIPQSTNAKSADYKLEEKELAVGRTGGFTVDRGATGGYACGLEIAGGYVAGAGTVGAKVADGGVVRGGDTVG